MYENDKNGNGDKDKKKESRFSRLFSEAIKEGTASEESVDYGSKTTDELTEEEVYNYDLNKYDTSVEGFTPDSDYQKNLQTKKNLHLERDFGDYMDVGSIDITNMDAARRRRAVNQSTKEQVGRSGINLVSDFAGGLITDVGLLGELAMMPFEEKKDFSNVLTRFGESLMGAGGEVYRENPDEAFDFGDGAFWLSGGQQLVSSIARFAIGGKGIGAVIGKAGRAVTGAMKLGMKAEKVANAVVRGNRMARGISKVGTGTINFIEGTGTQVASSGFLSYLEAGLGGSDTYKFTYDAAIKAGLGEEVANKKASDAAVERTALQTAVMLPLNFGIVGPMFRKARTVEKLNKYGFGRKSLKVPTEGSKGLKDIRRYKKHLDDFESSDSFKKYLKEGQTGLSYGAESGKEAIEESVDVFFGGYGKSIGTGDDRGEAIKRGFEEVVSPEGQAAAFWGAFGGGGHKVIMERVLGSMEYERDGDGNKIQKTDKEGNPLKDKYKKRWKTNHRKIKEERQQLFDNHQQGMLKDIETIEEIYNELEKNGTSIDDKSDEFDFDKKKDELFNILNFNSVVAGRGENLVGDFENIEALDNEKDLADDLMKKEGELTEQEKAIRSIAQSEQRKLTEEEQSSLDDITKEKEKLDEKIKEVSGKTEAMQMGFARNKKDNNYKKEARQAIEDIREADELYNHFKTVYSSNEESEYSIPEHILRYVMRSKVYDKSSERYEDRYKEELDDLLKGISNIDVAKHKIDSSNLKVLDKTIENYEEFIKGKEDSKSYKDKLEVKNRSKALIHLKEKRKELKEKVEMESKVVFGELNKLTEENEEISSILYKRLFGEAEEQFKKEKAESSSGFGRLKGTVTQRTKGIKNKKRKLEDYSSIGKENKWQHDDPFALKSLVDDLMKKKHLSSVDKKLIKVYELIEKGDEKSVEEGVDLFESIYRDKLRLEEGIKTAERKNKEDNKIIRESKESLEEAEEAFKKEQKKVNEEIGEDDKIKVNSEVIDKIMKDIKKSRKALDKNFENNNSPLIDYYRKSAEMNSISKASKEIYKEYLTKEGRDELIEEIKDAQKQKAKELIEINKRAEEKEKEKKKEDDLKKEAGKKQQREKAKNNRKKENIEKKKEEQDNKTKSKGEKEKKISEKVNKKVEELKKVILDLKENDYLRSLKDIDSVLKAYEVLLTELEKGSKKSLKYSMYKFLSNAFDSFIKNKGNTGELEMLKNLSIGAVELNPKKFMDGFNEMIEGLDKDMRKMMEDKYAFYPIKDNKSFKEKILKIDEITPETAAIIGEAYSKSAEVEESDEEGSKEDTERRGDFDRLQKLIEKKFEMSGKDASHTTEDRFIELMEDVLSVLKNETTTAQLINEATGRKGNSLEAAQMILDHAKSFYTLMSKNTEEFSYDFTNYKIKPENFELYNDSREAAEEIGRLQHTETSTIALNSVDMENKKAVNGNSISGRSRDMDPNEAGPLEVNNYKEGDKVTFEVVDDPSIPIYEYTSKDDGSIEQTKSTWGEKRKELEAEGNDRNSEEYAMYVPIEVRDGDGNLLGYYRAYNSVNEGLIAHETENNADNVELQRRKVKKSRKEIMSSYNNNSNSIIEGKINSISLGSLNSTKGRKLKQLNETVPAISGTGVVILESDNVSNSESSTELNQKQRSTLENVPVGTPMLFHEGTIMQVASVRVDGKIKTAMEDGVVKVLEKAEDMTEVVTSLIKDVISGKDSEKSLKELNKIVFVNNDTDKMNVVRRKLGEGSALFSEKTDDGYTLILANQSNKIDLGRVSDIKNKEKTVKEMVGKIRSNVEKRYLNSKQEVITGIDEQGNYIKSVYKKYQGDRLITDIAEKTRVTKDKNGDEITEVGYYNNPVHEVVLTGVENNPNTETGEDISSKEIEEDVDVDIDIEGSADDLFFSKEIDVIEIVPDGDNYNKAKDECK